MIVHSVLQNNSNVIRVKKIREETLYKEEIQKRNSIIYAGPKIISSMTKYSAYCCLNSQFIKKNYLLG